MSDTEIFELKERAKWSKDSAEKKTAIRELSARGNRAIPALDEILSVTAYDEIKTACIEAIKAIEGKGAAAQDQKKEEQKDDAGAGVKLADLPP